MEEHVNTNWDSVKMKLPSYLPTFMIDYTVEPLHNGHPGAELSGRYGEVAVVGRFQ